jgi:V-type H+-transporting ATPase subunit C
MLNYYLVHCNHIYPLYRAEEESWLTLYETLAQYVVPRSSRKVFEDGENGLWCVVLFKRAVDDFKNAAREHKFIVRKYEPSIVVDPEAKKKQITERDRQKVRQLMVPYFNTG